MAIKQICKAGHPVLRQISKPVDLNTLGSISFNTLLNDMRDTMHHLQGAGIAAPQIGVNQSVMMYEIHQNPRYPDAPVIPETIWINLCIEHYSEEKAVRYEGCLSLPDLRGLVPRSTAIEISGYNLSGVRIEKKITGFEARVVQHEYDHLIGKYFIEHIENFDYFGYTDELEKR